MDVFSNLAAIEGDFDIERKQAEIAVEARVAGLRSFVVNASSPEEQHERVSVVSPQVRKVAYEVAEEYGFYDRQAVYEHALDHLRTAADPLKGETSYQHERQSLPASKDGLGGPVDPQISLQHSRPRPIDVGSKRNELERQRMGEEPQYDTEPKLQTEVSKQVDADSPIGEEQKGSRTDTWSGETSAVTASVESKYRLV